MRLVANSMMMRLLNRFSLMTRNVARFSEKFKIYFWIFLSSAGWRCWRRRCIAKFNLFPLENVLFILKRSDSLQISFPAMDLWCFLLFIMQREFSFDDAVEASWTFYVFCLFWKLNWRPAVMTIARTMKPIFLLSLSLIFNGEKRNHRLFFSLNY